MLPNGGLHDFSELKLIFGLDGAYSTDSITVFWPSGIEQRIGQTQAGENIVIVEDTITTNQNEINICQSPTKIWPNPFNDKFNIEFYLLKDERVSISIMDLSGKRIMQLANETTIKGTYKKSFSTNSLARGIYILQLSYGTNTEYHKITVSR